MTAWRQAIELAIGEKDLAELGAIARSRTEPASRVERARMLLAYEFNRHPVVHTWSYKLDQAA